MKSLTVFINIISITCILTFKYTLPGDKDWPTFDQFDALKKNIKGNVALRGESSYDPHTWNRITNVPKPAIIVKPKNADDIIEALKFTKKHKLRLSVQSTGHHQDHRNIYDNAVHIDMSTMNSKSLNIDAKTLTLGPGNNFSQISAFLKKETNNKLVALCGADPGVGIYGWTIGGGHGSLTRLLGLGVDSLISVEIILANFSVVTASESQNSDLFRSLRGSGGGAFGIVTSLTVKLYDSPSKISVFNGYYELSNKTSKMFATWAKNAPNEVSAYYIFFNFGKDRFVTISAACVANASFCGPILSQLNVDCAAVLGAKCEPILDRYETLNDLILDRGSDTNGVTYLSSTALNSANIETALPEITNYISENMYTACYGNFVLGGASADIDKNQEKTSVAPEMRQSIMGITCASALEDKNTADERSYQVAVMDKLAIDIFSKYSKWVYWNEPQHNFLDNDWKERYWGGLVNYNRLLAVKRLYDPENFFTCYHCIGYENIENEDPSVCPADKCTCSNTPNGVCANTNRLNNAHALVFNFKILISTVFLILISVSL